MSSCWKQTVTRTVSPFHRYYCSSRPVPLCLSKHLSPFFRNRNWPESRCIYHEEESRRDTYLYVVRCTRRAGGNVGVHGCHILCVFSLFLSLSVVNIIAWRKPSSAAGCRCVASPRSIHQGDVSVCIVIEWYNKGWSPWETENRTTWRIVGYDVEKAAPQDRPRDRDRCYDAVNTDPVGNCRENGNETFPFKRRRLTGRFNGFRMAWFLRCSTILFHFVVGQCRWFDSMHITSFVV